MRCWYFTVNGNLKVWLIIGVDLLVWKSSVPSEQFVVCSCSRMALAQLEGEVKPFVWSTPWSLGRVLPVMSLAAHAVFVKCGATC